MLNIKKIEQIIHTEVSPAIKVVEERGTVALYGELDNWDDVLKAGNLAVHKDSLGVVNRIKLKGYEPKMLLPDINDQAYEGRKPDVVIIGAGVVGSAIARELSRFKLDVMLLEKEYDVAMAASSRNDGEVHPGIDLHKGQLKLHYNGIGNKMYPDLCKDLGVEFRRQGQVIVFSKGWERLIAPLFALKAKMNGLYNYRYLNKKKLKELEPNVPDWNYGGFFTGSAGVVCPYKLTIALAENAVQNGVQICLNTAVTGMDLEGGEIKSVKTNRGTIYPKVVINAAGVFSDIIADMAGDRTFTIHPRKGTILILDKKAQKNIVNTIMGKSPIGDIKNYDKHTKGGGVVQTIDGNVLVGPNAVETPDREDISTCSEGVDAILQKQIQVAPKMTRADVITYFSGVRAPTYEEDFVIRKGLFTKNIVQAAGIQSPGLTAAPAIAIDVAKLAVELLGGAKPNTNFNPVRKAIPHLAEMSDEERNKKIKENPDYGIMVCRCEEVSKGEIEDALSAPFVVPSVDAIKRRVRAGMGRCQGGFCGPLVVQIISRKTGLKPEEITKGNNKGYILIGDTKEGKV